MGEWNGKRVPTGFGLRRARKVFEVSAKIARNYDATKCVTDKAASKQQFSSAGDT